MKLWILLLPVSLCAQGYKKPAREILDVLNAPASPQEVVSPARTHMLLLIPRRHPPISEVSQPVLRLAGLRIDPRNNGRHLPPTFVSLSVIKLDDGKTIPVQLPANARLSLPRFSPDGKLFAFTSARPDAIDLWIADTATARARLIPGIAVNAAAGETLQWMPDSRSLLVQTVRPNRGTPPAPPSVPSGPRIQESSGRYAPVRTHQDMLTSIHDETLFTFYATSQVMLVDAQSSKAVPVGEPGLYHSFDPSPNGRLILFQRAQRPFSYLVGYTSFPREIGVWERSGKLLAILFRKPLADAVPIDGVATGPRSVAWRPDEPATLTWAEALDDGDPRKSVPFRDRLMSWKAPFQGQPAEWMRTEHRFDGIDWGRGFALVRDYDRARKWNRTLFLDTMDKGTQPRVVFSRSAQDKYADPGTPVESTAANGHRMLLQEGDEILLNGLGARPTGARPFLDRFNVKTGKKSRVFLSSEDSYEKVITALKPDGSLFLTERENPTTPPNYFVRAASGSRPLTHFTDPTPQLRRIRKQLVTYKRADGVDLSFTLYTPPDYQPGVRLPTVVWAYPREFASTDTAGQFGGSTQRFTTFPSTSHLFFLLAGYAVLDDASIPVVGNPATVNNTYVEQIVAGAKAAIDKAVEIGVTDPARVGVGGHSYGAFMTANLLAHSDLFKAGIARSGAYNRTLTPFGFQAERRTFWEATGIYLKMSPFMVADKINEPILLIHGEADNNDGTFPIQSERMYQAVRGNGGKVRLVFLPHESHSYVARESIEHTLAEMIEWFDRFLKNAPETPNIPVTQEAQ